MKLKMSYDSILIKSLLTSGAIVCKLRLTSMGAKALIHDFKIPQPYSCLSDLTSN